MSIKNPKILVIDDDLSVLSAFQIYFQDQPIELVLRSSADIAVDEFRIAPQGYACAFVDYQLVNEFGEQEAIGHEIVKELKSISPSLYVVMMSGDDSKEALNQWLSSGVEKFLYKPLREELLHTFTEFALAQYKERHPHLNTQLINHYGLVGVSENLKKVVKYSKKFAPSDEAVLIMGETGTGKELVAHSIHKQSKRRNKPFIALNCAAITGSLFESELFGHTKGAFTGAETNKLGKFREAHGGTLFLDEIHHLSLEQQAKLLRVIQEKRVQPVGDRTEHGVDFRLVCASKPNLRELSLKNEFLIDLYFRISSLNIELAPLKARRDDIEPLINYFQKNMEKTIGKFKRFTPTALKQLKDYHWPGNVRELQKIICELYLVVDRNAIESADLPKVILESTQVVDIQEGMTMGDLDKRQRQQKRSLIKSVMVQAEGNKTKAAQLLGMKRSTFIWVLKDLQIYDLYEAKNKLSMAQEPQLAIN
ncbi:MAG: sigma-54-dependent Fis family transcriptional regulator [Bdellovibrionaceae bacterium]|jgi:DNA-binding NtrC family response regulator|nr:sigma-54-dependent Fis family transcriptional regulator [Pseudobdellovibrionaceae bacterium]